jgi:hypothetical protein
VITDFLKRLYKKRQQSDDAVLRRLYQIAEMARTDPDIIRARQIIQDEFGLIEGQAFDQMFASYWITLEHTADIGEQLGTPSVGAQNNRDWNVDLEPMLREIGIDEDALLAGRTNLKIAVLHRTFLRIATDGLAKARGRDLVEAFSEDGLVERDANHDVLIKSAERAIKAMIDEGIRKNKGAEVLARLRDPQIPD